MRSGSRSRAKMLADFSGNSMLADAYRTIRTNLALLQISSDEPTVVVVTSATSEEGKSAVAANLAHGLSVMGKNVLAVSADLHNPSLHEYFALVNGSRPLIRTPDTARARRRPRQREMGRAETGRACTGARRGEPRSGTRCG